MIMDKDWKGNGKAAFTVIGATGHSVFERERNDYYATHPDNTEWLCRLEGFSRRIWEPACGEGHISKVLESHGYEVRSTDLIDRGYGMGGVDFLMQTEVWDGDIVTNPPYGYATEFVERALQVVTEGRKVAMFLKLTFLEGKRRKELFRDFPPKVVYVSSGRAVCARNGEFGRFDGSAIAYAWFVWEKGYEGETVVRWFN